MYYRAFHYALLLVLLFLLTACVAQQRLTSPLVTPTTTVRTLNSAVSIAVTSGDQSVNLRGYLVLRQPDRFRLTLLSPFGTVAAELFLIGDRVTFIDSQKQQAYSGNLQDAALPPPFSELRQLPWILQFLPPSAPVRRSSKIETNDGRFELREFNTQGLIVKKLLAPYTVDYEEYQLVGTAALPFTIMLSGNSHRTVRLTFSEPEVNTEIEEELFTPRIEQLPLLPLNKLPLSGQKHSFTRTAAVSCYTASTLRCQGG